MRHLPTELTDYIIDYLHSDRRALGICSLVCQNWLPASRFHLFRTITIYFSDVHYFIELLAPPSSTITHYTHRLEILTHVVSLFETVEPAEVPVFNIIAPYLKHFVALNTITLHGLRWIPVSEDYLSRELGRIGYMNLTRVFCDFSSWWFTLDFIVAEHGPPSSFSSSLRAVGSAFDGIDGQHPTSWLPVVVQLPAINEVELSGIANRNLMVVQAVLKLAGELIHTVKLDFALDLSQITLILNHVDLTHNTNLRSLSIRNLDMRKFKKLAGHGTFYKMIERISSHYVTHIRIGVVIKDWVDLTWMDFRTIENELNHPRFSKLQEMCIDIRGVLNNEDEMARVRREMPVLDRRNVLALTIG